MKLEFPAELSVGEATLLLEYTGALNDQMRGFYRSKYTDPTSPGTVKYAATTQFEVYLQSHILSHIMQTHTVLSSWHLKPCFVMYYVRIYVALQCCIYRGEESYKSFVIAGFQ